MAGGGGPHRLIDVEVGVPWPTTSTCVRRVAIANNGWLQELPDNMTKLVWDNAAIMSPHTARELGLDKDDLVTRCHGGADVRCELPVFVTPGLADFSIHLPLGYGRTRPGEWGTASGFNAYRPPPRREPASASGLGSTGGESGRELPLVTTQEHHTMNGYPVVFGRRPWRTTSEHPDFATEMVEMPKLVTLYTDREYDYSQGNQWGMTIDLTTCIGCNACAIACQSENNIAIVGKDQVNRGREMHWIRIDRYYTGEPRTSRRPVISPFPA